MEQYHGRSKKTNRGTGARVRKKSDKKLSKVGGPSINTRVVNQKTSEELKIVRTRGGNEKIKPRKSFLVNVAVKENGKNIIKKAEVKSVAQSPENRHHARMNIIAKGSILETNIGKVKVTSRPGQDGVINGVLVS
ncbi:30S ribosomal protein S8e [Candidatus Micrarchaeota archaeon]|jgi:small subunit ribosomal protein S8e|nr:30S ribosomal protein S8e [Candidatus Micrarchaeota archaeon]